MDKTVFEHFPEISEKQWKQKIQFLLQGEEYQKLIDINSDGISTLPFYTKKHLQKTTNFKALNTTKPAFYSIVTNEIEANKEALEAIKRGIDVIYFAVFNAEINLSILLLNIKCHIIFQCYFLETEFSKSPFLKGKKYTILNNCLGKISKTGNWYYNYKKDFKITEKILSYSNHTININLSTLHNAGATAVQQLSYGITQLITYSNTITIHPEIQIVYNLSVSTNFHHEIAKIKALRILHYSISKSLSLNPKCKIIQHKSKRNLSGLYNQINKINTYTERHIAILGGVDYYLSSPYTYSFFKEDHLPLETNIEQLKEAKENNDPTLADETIYIEKLIQQLLEKSTSLIETIIKGGGYIEQLKKGTIQQKIASNETSETDAFIKNTSLDFSKNSSFQYKTPISYPFLKFKKRKTLWKPIIEKQLREGIERPIWEKHFNL